MRNKALMIVAFVLVLSALATPCHSQDIESRLDSFFTSLSERDHLNGCVLIADRGDVIYERAFGYSDFDLQTKLTTNSMFDLASIAKQFTAFGIVILHERGLLDYATDIRTYFPGLSYDGITVRHLLYHTSGLINSEDLTNEYWDKSKIITNADLLNLLARNQPPLYFRPGAQYRYSNTGYILLALIIERISGSTFSDFLHDNIFAPLGMKRTQVYSRRYLPEAIDDYALGYVLSLEHHGYALPDSVVDDQRVITMDGLQGDGSISSTAQDLYRWDRSLYTDTIVPQSAIQEALSPGRLDDGTQIDIGFEGNSYGFGWRIHDSDDGKMVWHSGHYPGYSNLIIRYTDIDRTIICLSNNGYEWYWIMSTINDIVKGEPVNLPSLSFAEELRWLLIAEGDSVSVADSIQAMVVSREEFRIDERRINELGYELLKLRRFEDAIAVFACNTKLFPSSANVYDSQGEAYMLNGEFDMARKCYTRSLELDSSNANAREMLKKMTGER